MYHSTGFTPGIPIRDLVHTVVRRLGERNNYRKTTNRTPMVFEEGLPMVTKIHKTTKTKYKTHHNEYKQYYKMFM